MKLRYYVSMCSQCSEYDEDEVDDEEWNKMSDEEKDEYCRQGIEDSVWNHVDSWWKAIQ